MTRAQDRILWNPRQRFLENFLADLLQGRERTLRDHAQELAVDEAELREEHAAACEIVHTAPAPSSTPLDDPELGFSVDERLGPYRVQGVLGRGAQGIVLRAIDERLQVSVAIKVLRPRTTFGANARDRFTHEGALLGRVQHPNVCPVLAAGSVRGFPYIAMRFIEGPSLAEHLRGRARTRAAGPFADARADLRSILHSCAGLARGLHAAHSVGVVHRDVKPSNVILTREGVPVLVDFGLARDTSGELTELSLTGERFGTIGYMAPEQAGLLGPSSGLVGPRSDVFSLGVLLHEWVCGSLPFAAQSIHAYEGDLRTSVGPPDPRRHHPAATRDLRHVLLRALAFRPADRFADAAELASELERMARGEATAAAPVGSLPRIWRWARRNRLVAGFTSAMLLVLCTALCVTLYLLGRERDAATAASHMAYRTALTSAQANLESGAVLAAREALGKAPEHERGIEHAMLTALLTSHVWEGRLPATPTAAALVDRWRLLLAHGDDGAIVLVDFGQGTPPRCRDLYACGAMVVQLRCGPKDGRWYAKTPRASRGCRLFSGNLDRHGPVVELSVPTDVRDVCVLPNARQTCLFTTSSSIETWQPEMGEHLPLVELPPGFLCYSVTPSPCGRYLGCGLTNSQGGMELRLYDLRTCSALWSAQYWYRSISAMAFGGTGDRLLVASTPLERPEALRVEAWTSAEPIKIGSLEMQGGLVPRTGQGPPRTPFEERTQMVDFGHVVALHMRDGTIRWLDGGLWRERGASLGRDSSLQQLLPASDGSFLLATDHDGGVLAWDPERPLASLQLDTSVRGVTSLAFDPVGRHLAAGNHDGEELRIWDLRAPDRPLHRKAYRPRTVGFTSDGAGIQFSGELSCGVVPLQPGTAQEQQLSHLAFVTCGSRPGEFLARDGVGEDQFSVRLITGLQREATRELGVVHGNPELVRVTPSSGVFVSCKPKAGGSITYAARGKGESLTLFHESAQTWTAAQFSRDGQHLALGSVRGDITIHDWARNELRASFHVGPAAISALEWHPEPNRIVCADADGKVHICAVGEAGPLVSLRAPKRSISALAVSPDGKSIACGFTFGGVCVWSAGQRAAETPAHLRTLQQEARRIVYEAELEWGFPQAAPDLCPTQELVEAVTPLALGAARDSSAYRPDRQFERRLAAPLLPPEIYGFLAARVSAFKRHADSWRWDTSWVLCALRDGDMKAVVERARAARKPNDVLATAVQAFASDHGLEWLEATSRTTSTSSRASMLWREARMRAASGAEGAAWRSAAAAAVSCGTAPDPILSGRRWQEAVLACGKEVLLPPDERGMLALQIAQASSCSDATYRAAAALVADGAYDSAAPELLESLAACLLRLGATDKALALLDRREAQLGPARSHPRLHALLAWAAAQAGDRVRAVRHRELLARFARDDADQEQRTYELLLYFVDRILQPR